MDTSEETVFLHVQTLGAEVPLGNIFVSDGSGKYYTSSLQNVLRGTELVDFEKVNSLEGVFLANKFEESSSHAARDSIIGKDSKGKGKKEFTKAEVEAQAI
jgi:Sortilin, neurotensin receptor 3,